MVHKILHFSSWKNYCPSTSQHWRNHHNFGEKNQSNDWSRFRRIGWSWHCVATIVVPFVGPTHNQFHRKLKDDPSVTTEIWNQSFKGSSLVLHPCFTSWAHWKNKYIQNFELCSEYTNLSWSCHLKSSTHQNLEIRWSGTNFEEKVIVSRSFLL